MVLGLGGQETPGNGHEKNAKFRGILLCGLLSVVLGASAAPGHAGTPCTVGSYPYTQKIAAGASITLYTAPSVAKGASCEQISVNATCRAGNLIGAGMARYPGCMELEGFTGINFNAGPQALDERMLPDTGAKYVRAFIDVIALQRATSESLTPGAPSAVINPAAWQTLKDATSSGAAKMILNLKWDFQTAGMHPPLPDSEVEFQLFHFLDSQILDPMGSSVFIIVSGNEPFVETMDSDWKPNSDTGEIPMIMFYKRATKHINDYLIEHELRNKVKLFVGAFTRLEMPGMQKSQAALRLLAFADKAPYVDGVDIHLHVNAIEDMNTALNFAQSRTIKPFLVTEYTDVYRAKDALAKGLPLGETFAQKWGLPSAMTEIDFLRCRVFHVGSDCSKLPMILPAEWYDFIATRSWFDDQFLLNTDAIFRRFRVVGTTFGAVQRRPSPSDLEPTGTPWYLYSLYSPAAIGYQESGLPNSNYQYLDNFRQLSTAAN